MKIFGKNRLNAASGRVWFSGLMVAIILAAIAAGCKNSASASSEPAQTPAAQNQPAPAQTVRPEEFDPKPGTPPAPKVDGKRALKLVSDYVSIGPRGLGSSGHKKAEDFITSRLKQMNVAVELDSFQANTAAGPFPVTNIIGKIPGTKDGIIVVAGHYETNLPTCDDLKPATDSGQIFVGANDSGSDTGLMLELAGVLQKQKGSAQSLDGYSVWFVFTDAEEATVKWSDADSVYGSKHLAQKWSQDGTARKIKAFLLLDMIGDASLDVQRETKYATPWLEDVIFRAAQRMGSQKYFFADESGVEDDHKPFSEVGIPVADIIDLDYGPGNLYHHTSQDTMDKLSAKSLQIVGDVVLETMRAINTR